MRFRAYFGSLLAIAGAALLLSIPTAQADTIVTNFGIANSYLGGTGWTVAGTASASGFFQSAAMPFDVPGIRTARTGRRA